MTEQHRETRIKWRPQEELPEGWRWLENQTLHDDGRYTRSMTSAPEGGKWWEHETRSVEFDRVIEERFVTEWVEVSE